MALTAPVFYTMRDHNPLNINSYPVQNAEVIYKGAFVGIESIGVTTGRLINWSSASSAVDWIGIADPTANSVTGNSGGTVECPVIQGPVTLVGVTVTGVNSADDVGDAVYATDENTMTLSATSNVGSIGWVSRWYSSTTCDVTLFSPNEYRGVDDKGQV